MANYKTPNNARIFLAFILAISGVVLLIMGMLIPPMGQIDSSVLVSFGECLTFVSAILGVDVYYKTKYNTHIRHHKTRVVEEEESDDDNEE